jgi:Protein of unknown function (DUF2000)
MGVTEFDTKVAVVVREGLATWQRLNVTAFLISGVCAQAGPAAIGEDYVDAHGRHYLPLLVQPVLVFEAGAAKLETLRERAERRGVPWRSTPCRCSAPATTRTTAPRSETSPRQNSSSPDSAYARRIVTRTLSCAASSATLRAGLPIGGTHARALSSSNLTSTLPVGSK